MGKEWKSKDGLSWSYEKDWAPGEHAAYAKRVDEMLYGKVNAGEECGICRGPMVPREEKHGFFIRRNVTNAIQCANCGWKSYR